MRDFSGMSNAYLKTLITERGYSTTGLLTREEVSRVRQRIDNDYPYSGEVSFVPLAWAALTLRKVCTSEPAPGPDGVDM